MKFFKPEFWDKNKISFFSILLLPFSLLVRIVTKIKPFVFKKNYFSSPVICIGNIYLGGTGKTPLCIELFSILKKLNRNPAFIRKKYKKFKDESLILKNIGPLYEENNRKKALLNAFKNNIDVAILDDGYQDFTIHKDFSIVCFSEKYWIGNGHIIPSGPLREDLSALKRANCVVINGNKNSIIEAKILKNNNNIKIFYAKYIALNISDFKNKKIISFAGIGNPSDFFQLLKKNEINTLENIAFPDHYNYSEIELKNLIEKANNLDAILLTTEKDYLRINIDFRKKIKCLKIKIEIENQNQFIKELNEVI